MRAWHHCMAETHNRELCDAGARWELKMLPVLLVLIFAGGMVASYADQIARDAGASERVATRCAVATIFVMSCGLTAWLFR